MKLATLKNGTGVVVIDDHVVALADLDGVPDDVTAVRAAGPQVASDVSRKAAEAAQRTPLMQADLGAPIPRPSKYLAIGFKLQVPPRRNPGSCHATAVRQGDPALRSPTPGIPRPAAADLLQQAGVIHHRTLRPDPGAV